MKVDKEAKVPDLETLNSKICTPSELQLAVRELVELHNKQVSLFVDSKYQQELLYKGSNLLPPKCKG